MSDIATTTKLAALDGEDGGDAHCAALHGLTARVHCAHTLEHSLSTHTPGAPGALPPPLPPLSSPPLPSRRRLAEFGVVFFLFEMGLELELERLQIPRDCPEMT